MREYKVKRTALIDADFIAYSMAAWAHGNQADALELHSMVMSTLQDWMDRSCTTEAIMCFSCPREENYRRDHYPLYKSHRTSEPPAMLPLAKKTLADCADRVVTIDRLEADDIMGILATNGKVLNPVIITVDKDLRQIPGWHFNPDKEDFPVFVSERDGNHLFYQQWLTGDSTDNFGGIKGVGPKTAEKILGPDPYLWEIEVLSAYAEKGYTLEEALGQARCARILRDCDFCAETRTAIPWEPSPGSVGAVYAPEEETCEA